VEEVEYWGGVIVGIIRSWYGRLSIFPTAPEWELRGKMLIISCF
jgi:hypothetical protein